VRDTGIFRASAVAYDLRGWAERDWSDGVQIDALAGLEQFTVRTRNTTYELTVLTPSTGDVLVRGGLFFPEHTRVRVAGCSLGGSFLKLRAIHPGFAMELVHDGRRIVTTGVRDIQAVRARGTQ
jgi:hypothetical protein